MDKNSIRKIGFRLSFMPLLVILVFLILSGGLFYFYGNLSSIKDSHKFYLFNLLSYKKSQVDQWFETYIRAIEELKNSDPFKEKVLIASGEHPFIKSNKRLAEARQDLTSLLEEMKLTGRYKSLSILSRDGKVLVSSDNNLIGLDLSQKVLFKEIGLSDYLSTLSAFEEGEGLSFITAITDKKNQPISFLYIQANLKDLLSLLSVEDSLYSSRLEIMNEAGRVLLTKDAQKRDFKKPLKDNLIETIDGNLFYAKNVKIPNIYLVGSLSEIDSKGSYYLLIAIYLSLIGVVITLLILSTLRGKRIIRPLEGFTEHMRKLVSSDSFNVEVDSKGEIKELKEALMDIFEELKMRDAYIAEKERIRVSSYLKSRFYGRFIEELKPLLPSMPIQKHSDDFDIKAVSVYSEGRIYPKEMANGNFWLFQLSEDLSMLYMLENKNLSVLVREFSLNDLIKEIEGLGKALMKSKEIELIIDCIDSLKDSFLHTDRFLLKKMLTNLIINSFKYTKIGTITLLFSEVTKHDKKYLEILLSDTGEGLDLIDTEDLSLPLSLLVVKRLSHILGGTMDIDSLKGKGTMIRVLILEDLEGFS